MQDELGGKIMTEFAVLRAKHIAIQQKTTIKIKKSKDTKKCVIKPKLIFEDYKNCLETTQIENKKKNIEKKKNETDIDNLRENNKEFIP